MNHEIRTPINGILGMTELALDTDLTPEQRGSFDMVLMDVQMPIMDGFEAIAAIRALEERSGAHLPITAMTAHAMQGDRDQCLHAGMDDYLPKSMKAADFSVIIESVLETTPVVDDAPPEPVLDSRPPACPIGHSCSRSLSAAERRTFR